MLSRLFTRRRSADADEDDYEEFRLPAPDAAFERPWLRTVPHPTRDWSDPASALAPPDLGVAEDEPESAPPRQEPQVRTEIAVPAPQDVPSPAAGAPVRPRPRPSPRSGGGTAPPPEVRAAQPATAPPRRRPRPGPAGQSAGWTGISSAPPHASPFERAPVAQPRPSQGGRQSDLSRFLKSAESEADDEEGDAASPTQRPTRRDRWRRLSIWTFVWLVIAALAALLLRSYVIQPYYIPSESMEPTLHGCTGCSDDHVLVDKISYRLHDVRSGDIVVFHKPKGDPSPEKVLIKRVVALPGDTLQLKQGHVYVNGLLLPESYVNKKCGPEPTQPLTSTTRWTIPEGDVFVMGDNRCHSDDSRVFGPIRTSSIVGRAFAIVWPLDRIQLL
jgi:signal peptidase I